MLQSEDKTSPVPMFQMRYTGKVTMVDDNNTKQHKY